MKDSEARQPLRSRQTLTGASGPENLRRATRYYFGGVVELTHESGLTFVAMVRGLNLYGCFVKTGQSFKLGTKVLLTMTHEGTHFSARGRIANQNETGIGVEFTDISSEDRSRLETCLSELARNETESKRDS